MCGMPASAPRPPVARPAVDGLAGFADHCDAAPIRRHDLSIEACRGDRHGGIGHLSGMKNTVTGPILPGITRCTPLRLRIRHSAAK